MTNNTDHSLDAAKGDLLLGLLEDLGQIDVCKIASTYEKDVILRFVLDSIGLAQDIFFSDTESDLRGAVERAALARNYVRSMEARFDAINSLAAKNVGTAEVDSEYDPS